MAEAERIEIRFDGNENLNVLFEGEWVGWRTVWGMPDYDKNRRFRAFRKEAARRIVACVNACTGMENPEAEIQSLRATWGLNKVNGAEITRLHDQVRRIEKEKGCR